MPAKPTTDKQHLQDKQLLYKFEYSVPVTSILNDELLLSLSKNPRVTILDARIQRIKVT